MTGSFFRHLKRSDKSLAFVLDDSEYFVLSDLWSKDLILNSCAIIVHNSRLYFLLGYNICVNYNGGFMENIKKHIDFNCDLAQSFGVYKNNGEYDLLKYVSSVNVSCGFHAGDPLTIRDALLKAKEYNVAVGAHIGFDDIQGFGLKNMDLKPEEIEAIVLYQIGAVQALAKSCGIEIEFVRPHGAMYKRAAVDFEFSLAIANAIKKFDKWLIYYGATSEVLDKVAQSADIRVAHDVQLNRIYNEDGSIDYTSNSVSNVDFASNRLNNILRSSEVRNKEGRLTEVKCDSIHFSTTSDNILEIIQKANEIISPVPVNYKKAAVSGWV